MEFKVEMMTVLGALWRNRSFTINGATWLPGASAVNVGCTAPGSLKVAALPRGTDRSDHWYVNGWPSGSADALPSSVPSAPNGTVCAAPALATGGESSVLIVTVDGALSTVP